MNMILEFVNLTGKAFVDFALPMLAQFSILFLILLLIDFLLRRKMRAVFRCWMWMLVLAKLVLSPSLSSPISMGEWFGDRLQVAKMQGSSAKSQYERPAGKIVLPPRHKISRDIDLLGNKLTSAEWPLSPTVVDVNEVFKDSGVKLAGASEASHDSVAPVPGLSWQGVVFLLWLAVVIVMGLLLFQRAIFVNRLVAQSVEADDSIKDTFTSCCERMGVKRRIGLKVSANVTSPAVCGLFRPVILLAQNLTASLSAEQMRAVLLHELAHIKRGDLWVNLAQTILQILYFYNPLLWIANLIIRRIREQAVDETVLVAMGQNAKQYPQTLVSVAKLAFKRPVLSLRLIGVVESKSALAGRIKRILTRPVPRTSKLGILGLIAIIITAVILLPMAKAQKQAGQMTDVQVEDSISLPEIPQWVDSNVCTEKGGYALRFDGIDDFVRVQKNKSLEPENEITIEMWAFLEGQQNRNARLLRKAGDMQPGYILAADQLGDSTIQFRIDTPQGVIRAADIQQNNPYIGAWHHFAGVYDKEYATLYIDGEMISKVHDPRNTLTHSPVNLYIGHGAPGPREYFKGIIDEVRLWNIARTKQQIQHNMRRPLTGKEAGLAGYWKFDEGKGTTAFDSTGNHNDGQLSCDELNKRAGQVEVKSLEFGAVDFKAILPNDVAVELQPGKLVFHGRYQHRSRGQDIEMPSELWIKQNVEGNLKVLAYLPWRGSYDLASGDMNHRLESYRSGCDFAEGRTAYSIHLEFGDDKASLTRRGIRQNHDKTELAIPKGASFNPNSRPDSYCADNILLRGLDLSPGQIKELRVYDWDNSGEKLVDYSIHISHAGKELIKVPAGTFEANHLVLKQVTSADTWFKKRAGHITDFWVLDNYIIVRVVRHREPYEMELLEYTYPKDLGGKTEGQKTNVGQGMPHTDSKEKANEAQRRIDAAKPGDTVTVPRGLYTEPVEINKSLTIKGESGAECIFEVTANKPAIFVDTKGKGQVVVQDLTIKWQLATSDKGIERPFAFGVKDTQAEIKNCSFIPLGNFQRSPVAVRADGLTQLNISKCRFEGFEYVICYGEGTKGKTSDCLIMNCGHQGIINYTGSTLTVERNVITGSKFHAVRCTGGTLYVKDNLLINNDNRGIYLGNRSGSGTITNNLIIGNGTGIGCFARSKYEIKNNIIADSSYAGIGMEKSCLLTIQDNIFVNNERGWIMFDRGEKGANTCYRNTFWQNKVDAENFEKSANSINANPDFVDPNNGDFSLRPGPALEHKQGLTNPQIFKELWKIWKKRENKSETAVQAVADKNDESLQSKVAEPTVQKTNETRGRISGVVINAATGQPVAGAYVGVGDFGDSGGSNYERHRAQGFFAKAETDPNGRFGLDGLAYSDEYPEYDLHPLVVTHPEFVRYDEKIKLIKGKPTPDVRISLKPAAKINVIVVDSEGKPLEGLWLFRLEAMDGRRFIPPGQDPHLSAFASNVWLERPNTKGDKIFSTGFSFTELDGGEYAVEAIQCVPPELVKMAPEKRKSLLLNLNLTDSQQKLLLMDRQEITYHGGISNLKIEAGRTEDVQISPSNHQTSLEVKFPQDPYGKVQAPPFVWVTRRPGLFVDTTKVYHPEDGRLGRISNNAYFQSLASPGELFTIKNMPPGPYSIFAIYHGKVPTAAVFGANKPAEIEEEFIGPAIYLSSLRVRTVQGQDMKLELPPIKIEGPAVVKVWTLDRQVKLEAKQYAVKELCQTLTERTESNPRFIADASIENEKIKLGEGEVSIWELLERIYLDKGWKVEEGAEKTLIIRPVDKTSS